MVSSQDTAVAVALGALGYPVTPGLEVLLIQPDSPADGALAVRDIFQKVNGEPLSSDIATASDQLRSAIRATPPGESITFTVLRDGKEIDVPVTPENASADVFGQTLEGAPQVGIQLGQGFVLPFPRDSCSRSRSRSPSTRGSVARVPG